MPPPTNFHSVWLVTGTEDLTYADFNVAINNVCAVWGDPDKVVTGHAQQGADVHAKNFARSKHVPYVFEDIIAPSPDERYAINKRLLQGVSHVIVFMGPRKDVYLEDIFTRAKALTKRDKEGKAVLSWTCLRRIEARKPAEKKQVHPAVKGYLERKQTEKRGREEEKAPLKGIPLLFDRQKRQRI